MRVLSRFGHIVRAPGRITMQREDPGLKWRDFQPESSAYGRVRVGGDPWHGTESGFVASWIAGSEYVKISTGLVVFFPKGHLLYQGPIPNQQLLDDPRIATDQLDVMAGMEYFVPTRSRDIGRQTYAMAALNVIARAPHGDSIVEVSKGQAIAWFHLVAPPSSQTIDRLPSDGDRS
ncbi:MAG TPA: hypothetical protein VJT49_24855 [Amycolatopsis sp.]|uniref:hypothetical protein n=1 Tax=Amycolatopsis sp. TaxID=37632 RepID=UPI002B4A45EC|nr:hypothetical protein [Amycolatopsis sp.]HKS48280.1 hypothetical protein [Amycolatopsis sp.]